MKKIIAISVMLALITGAVFADTSVGGNLKISTILLKDKGAGDDVLAGGANVWDALINVNWSGDNAGGMMRLHSTGQDQKGIDWTPGIFTFWWWKPIDQLRLQLGSNADGDFGHQQITGWGYNAEAQGGIAIDQHRGIPANSSLARTVGAWYGGYGGLGLCVSIFPAPGFEIDLAIPFSVNSGDGYSARERNITRTASEYYLSSDINFKIDIPDIGTARVAFDLTKPGPDADQLIDAYLAFYLSAIENMGVELGLGFKNNGTENFKNIGVGLGFRLNAEDLTFKARLGFDMPDGGENKIGIGILPSYNLGSFVFYFNAGFGMNLDNSDSKDWFVNPYIRVPANAGNFYAGIKAIGVNDNDVTWEIPIGWNVYF